MIKHDWWRSRLEEFRKSVRQVETPHQTRKELYPLLLRQYEHVLKNEFEGRNLHLGEQTKTNLAIKALHEIEICILDPKYLNQYIFEYKKYYYEAKLDTYEKQRFYMELFYRKLSKLIA